MTAQNPAAQQIPLWEGNTPGIETAAPQHIPTIVPFPAGGDSPAGAVVVCPGGGYSGRAPHEGDPIAQRLNDFGIAGFVCHYRVAPYRHPFPMLDAQRAVRWVRAHAGEYGLNPERVGILGFSAGGHLAATVATHYDTGDPEAADPVDRLSCRPDAAVLCYPVISFGRFRHTGSMQNLIGETPPEELRQSLSNENQVTPDTPPTFLWHTADDAGVPVQNSLLLADSLAREGVPFELHIYQSGRHGLGLAPEDAHIASWSQLCAEWLKGLGF